ncbi:MAG: hypothetical protein JNM02_01315 [Anaerolineales bacterium]|nr:hypothetical protein [Anaerolineales bacterium]
MSELDVRSFFEFDEGDLVANRAGRLSEKQDAKISEAESGANQIFVWVGVILILMAIAVSYSMINAAMDAGWSFGSNSDMVGSFLALAVVWLLLGGFAFGSFKIAFSKLDYSLQKVEGKVNFVRVEKRVSNPSSSGQKYRTEQQYELRVGRVVFEDVDEELLNVIEDGDVYTFYYTKDTKDILSCEFISKGK